MGRKGKSLLLSAAILLLGSTLSVAAEAAEGAQGSVVVKANQPLNDAKLFVQAGDTVAFQAEGQWTVKPQEKVLVSADGEAGTSAPQGYELPGAPVGALLAVVSGKRHLVGSKAEITFEQSGQLFFTANTQSRLSAFAANQGSLTVKTQVRKAAAAEASGLYAISFATDQVVLTSGKEKKVLSLDQLRNEKIRNERGESVALPENAPEHLEALPDEVRIEMKGAQVLLTDPKAPQGPVQKGFYNADQKEFLVHLEGSFKPVGTCFFLYSKNITGKMQPAGQSAQIQGGVNLILTLACKGPQGQPGKGKVVSLSLPFTGTRRSAPP
ncbi:MAG: hypothetical protein AB1640_25665 [bacterium]